MSPGSADQCVLGAMHMVLGLRFRMRCSTTGHNIVTGSRFLAAVITLVMTLVTSVTNYHELSRILLRRLRNHRLRRREPLLCYQPHDHPNGGLGGARLLSHLSTSLRCVKAVELM